MGKDHRKRSWEKIIEKTIDKDYIIMMDITMDIIMDIIKEIIINIVIDVIMDIIIDIIIDVSIAQWESALVVRSQNFEHSSNYFNIGNCILSKKTPKCHSY